VLCSGWARYGLGDRTEAFGSAIGGTGGYGFAVHGGARYRLGATDGPQLSAGIGAYTAFRRIAPVGFTVPVMVGWAGDVDVFLGGSLLVIPVTTAGSLLVVQGEAGTRFDVESFPVYIAATYQGTSGFHAIGLSVGVGYNTAQ
jgi:hypothetical protein